MRPLFRVGESILVKAGQVPKGSSLYRGPYKVIKILGRYSFRLSDGQKWSTRAMKWWIDPMSNDEDPFVEGTHEGELPGDEGTRESRIRPEDRPGPDVQTKPRRTEWSNAGLPPERWSYPVPVRAKKT